MSPNEFLPEGKNMPDYSDAEKLLSRAALTGEILQAHAAMRTADGELKVDFGTVEGVIDKSDAAIGISTGQTREIAVIARVGKPICFTVIGRENGRWRLSRLAAQQRALDWMMENLVPGDIIPCRVTHIESFGVFVDIGCGIISFIGIENISVSRISHPRERFCVNQDIYAVVLAKDTSLRRVTLTHRELLGTWQQNVEHIGVGMTLRGIARGIESYGTFVELKPNLSGLAEQVDGISCGDAVSVYVKAIIPRRMKIKLVIIDRLQPAANRLISRSDYSMTCGRLTSWLYSPPCCEERKVETVFL